MSQESQLAPDIVSDIDEYGNAFSLAASDTQSPLLSQLDLATLTAPLSPLMIVSASASPTPSSPSTLASSSAPPSPRPQPAQQLINPYHSCCMHSYRPSPAPYHEQDILYTVPLPTPKNPDNELTVVVHPRWCPTCSMQRMQFLEDRTEEELVSAEKGQKLYPSQEESAFRIGVRSGRRAAIVLSPEAPDRETALEALLRFNTEFPDRNPYSLPAVFHKILGHNPAFTALLLHWDNLLTHGYALQTAHFDLATITRTCHTVCLSQQNTQVIGNAVYRFQEGQVAGMYWQWELEAAAFEWRGHRVFKKAKYTEALLTPLPHPLFSGKPVAEMG